MKERLTTSTGVTLHLFSLVQKGFAFSIKIVNRMSEKTCGKIWLDFIYILTFMTVSK